MNKATGATEIDYSGVFMKYEEIIGLSVSHDKKFATAVAFITDEDK